MAFINRYRVEIITVVIGLYLVFTLSLYALLMLIERKSFLPAYSYNLSIVLYQFFDQISVALFAYSFWALGLRLLTISNILSGFRMDLALKLFSLALIVLLLLALLYAPTQIRQKAKLDASPPQNAKALSVVLKLLSAAPAIGVIAGIILSKNEDRNISLALIAIMPLVLGYFLLPIMVLSFLEVVYLCFQEWPTIKLHGKRYVLENE
jgi:hypothetical protein